MRVAVILNKKGREATRNDDFQVKYAHRVIHHANKIEDDAKNQILQFRAVLKYKSSKRRQGKQGQTMKFFLQKQQQSALHYFSKTHFLFQTDKAPQIFFRCLKIRITPATIKIDCAAY